MTTGNVTSMLGQGMGQVKRVSDEAFGARLNRMAGARPEENLYEEKNALDKESFLKMMTEQLKHQDPFNPVKNDQFTQQMAMMAQLEQQVNMNSNLEQMLAGQNQHQLAALQLVGKEIQADRAAIYHDRDRPSTLSFDLPQDALNVTLEVTNFSGEPIRSIDMGTQNQGSLQTRWDGMTENGFPMPSGRYSYRINATDMSGNSISVPTKLEGRVNGVTSSQGVIYLLVDNQRVALNDVEMITEGKSKEDESKSVATNENVAASNSAVEAAQLDEAQKAAQQKEELQRRKLETLMPLVF